MLKNTKNKFAYVLLATILAIIMTLSVLPLAIQAGEVSAGGTTDPGHHGAASGKVTSLGGPYGYRFSVYSVSGSGDDAKLNLKKGRSINLWLGLQLASQYSNFYVIHDDNGKLLDKYQIYQKEYEEELSPYHSGAPVTSIALSGFNRLNLGGGSADNYRLEYTSTGVNLYEAAPGTTPVARLKNDAAYFSLTGEFACLDHKLLGLTSGNQAGTAALNSVAAHSDANPSSFLCGKDEGGNMWSVAKLCGVDRLYDTDIIICEPMFALRDNGSLDRPVCGTWAELNIWRAQTTGYDKRGEFTDYFGTVHGVASSEYPALLYVSAGAGDVAKYITTPLGNSMRLVNNKTGATTTISALTGGYTSGWRAITLSQYANSVTIANGKGYFIDAVSNAARTRTYVPDKVVYNSPASVIASTVGMSAYSPGTEVAESEYVTVTAINGTPDLIDWVEIIESGYSHTNISSVSWSIPKGGSVRLAGQIVPDYLYTPVEIHICDPHTGNPLNGYYGVVFSYNEDGEQMWNEPKEGNPILFTDGVGTATWPSFDAGPEYDTVEVRVLEYIPDGPYSGSAEEIYYDSDLELMGRYEFYDTPPRRIPSIEGWWDESGARVTTTYNYALSNVTTDRTLVVTALPVPPIIVEINVPHDTLNVTYHSNNGTPNTTYTDTFQRPNSVNIRENTMFSRSGWTFEGWLTEGNDEYTPGEAFTGLLRNGTYLSDNETLHLYAVWSRTTTGTDTRSDPQTTSGTDTGTASGTDTWTDSGVDSGTDSGTDTSTESGTDSGTDSGSDNSTDSGTDYGTDSGTETRNITLTVLAGEGISSVSGTKTVGQSRSWSRSTATPWTRSVSKPWTRSTSTPWTRSVSKPWTRSTSTPYTRSASQAYTCSTSTPWTRTITYSYAKDWERIEVDKPGTAYDQDYTTYEDEILTGTTDTGKVYGTTSYGTHNRTGSITYGAKSYGTTTYGAKSYGTTVYGAKSYGTTTYGAKSYGTTAYGAKSYGTTTYGAKSYGDWSPAGTSSISAALAANYNWVTWVVESGSGSISFTPATKDQSVTFTDNVTIRATASIAGQFHITYHPNNGTPSDTYTDSAYVGNSLTIRGSSTYSRSGWTFIGWYISGGAQQYTAGSTYTGTADSTLHLYAAWQKTENYVTTGTDSGTDTGTSSGTDTWTDSGTDTWTEGGTNNNGTDTGTDWIRTDSGTETGTDSGTDTGTDTGTDYIRTDSGTEQVDTKSGTETGSDSGTDTGTDTGTDYIRTDSGTEQVDTKSGTDTASYTLTVLAGEGISSVSGTMTINQTRPWSYPVYKDWTKAVYKDFTRSTSTPWTRAKSRTWSYPVYKDWTKAIYKDYSRSTSTPWTRPMSRTWSREVYHDYSRTILQDWSWTVYTPYTRSASQAYTCSTSTPWTRTVTYTYANATTTVDIYGKSLRVTTSTGGITPSTTYGAKSYGTTTYGTHNRSGAITYGAKTYGTYSYSAKTYGSSYYGTKSYGAEYSGATTYGAWSYTADKVYGSTSYGAKTYGAEYGTKVYGAAYNGTTTYGAWTYTGDKVPGTTTYGAKTYGAEYGTKVYGSAYNGSTTYGDWTNTSGTSAVSATPAPGFVFDYWEITYGKANIKTKDLSEFVNNLNAQNVVFTGSVTITAKGKPAINLSIEPIEPNASYRENTDVITSFRMYSDAGRDILPADNNTVSFEAYYYNGSTKIQIASLNWEKAVIPAGGDNLVFFKWHIPDNLAGKTVYCKATVNSDSSITESVFTDNTAVLEWNIIPKDYSATPDTRYETGKPSGYVLPSLPAPSAGSASWSIWEYDGTKLVKNTYGMTLSDVKASIVPDEDSFSAKYEYGVWTMRSGYGITVDYKPLFAKISGKMQPSDSAYTSVQSVKVLFPEFSYSNESGKYRTLEKTDGKWHFEENINADNNDRLHFIPIWFPDGSYTVSVIASDVWTPAGMITAVNSSNTITIDGSIYDDWYIQN